ncbi:GNAT family N-acetyltransferase [Bradyrhizobium sp. Bra78]|uniref:GNAT family N-acetyltransferase n=1 Tax=Bradyrhizobium sp. Bra78 TaxID=2926010 RepID=UPI0021C7CDFD|nr:GNAT family N-acetyltransferase [Bradyrhizobium sp. Bra78]
MLRDCRNEDAEAITRVAPAAFAEFEQHYSDWPMFSANVARIPELAKTGEIIVAEDDGQIAGAVAYVGSQAPKPAFFEPAWPIIRMLVVDPATRGKGIGRQLTEECLRRAERD